jgi:hypothetical protein
MRAKESIPIVIQRSSSFLSPVTDVAPRSLPPSADLCTTLSRRWRIDQIQFLPGHGSAQTTGGKYLGCKQRIRGAVSDKIGIEPPDSVYDVEK